LVSEIGTWTGYGQHAIQIVQWMQSSGYYVSIRALKPNVKNVPVQFAKQFVHCIQPEPIEILLSVPSRVPTPGKSVAFFTMWESTRLPPGYVDNCNKSTLVIVPSRWNKMGFEASGVTVPIHVVPLGIDPSVYFYRHPGTTDPFIFGAAGNLFNGKKRKGVLDVVESFKRVFKKETNVRLWVKCIGSELSDSDSRIQFFPNSMTDIELSWWYGNINCFASFTRGEGWGLMQHQAMAVGRPVISAVYGGLAEFMGQDDCYPVYFREVPAEELWSGLGNWAEPDQEHFELLLRHAYENREEGVEVGRRASRKAMQFTWQRSVLETIRLVEILEQSNATQANQGPLRLSA